MSAFNVGYPMRGPGPMMGAGQMRGMMRGAGPMMGSRMQYGAPNMGYQQGAMRGNMMPRSGTYMNPQMNQRGIHTPGTGMNYGSMPMRTSPMNAAAMYQRHSTMHSGYNRPGYW